MVITTMPLLPAVRAPPFTPALPYVPIGMPDDAIEGILPGVALVV
jgi:hypothetical protein